MNKKNVSIQNIPPTFNLKSFMQNILNHIISSISVVLPPAGSIIGAEDHDLALFATKRSIVGYFENYRPARRDTIDLVTEYLVFVAYIVSFVGLRMASKNQTQTHAYVSSRSPRALKGH